MKQARLGTQFVLLVLGIAAVNVVGGLLSAGGTSPTGWLLVPWLVTIILAVACFTTIGRAAATPDWKGVLIDQRNKMSLSRLQLVLWSILVVSAIVSEGILNATWGHINSAGYRNPLDLNIPKELWILLGLSSASFVAAPIVLGTKGSDLATKQAKEHAWSDIFYGDDTGNADQVDFSKVQQFFLTIVLILVYGVSLGSIFATTIPKSGLATFPPIDAGFIGIMAVSQTAYIAYKAIPQNSTDSAK